MAKGPASDAIMPGDKLKPLLALSKREPVQAAIALTSEGEGVILLDKKAKPRKVMSMLRAEASKAKLNLAGATIRFGRAEVDPEYDSAMVRFFINKEAPGAMRAKLVEVVKKISYQKVEFNIDPSLEEEQEDQDGEVAQEATPAVPAASAEPPPPPPPPPGDAAEQALRRALAGLAAQIPAAAGSDAARKATLLKVAGIANEQLKGHHVAEATVTIDKLRQVIGASVAASPAPGGPASGTQTAIDPAAIARWQAARGAWQDAIETVDGQIAALQKALRDTGDEDLEEIAEFGLNAVTADHKVPLMAAIMEIGQGSAETLAKSGPKALAAAQAFHAHINSDERVAACDENPDVPVSIRATLGAALAGLEAALAPA